MRRLEAGPGCGGRAGVEIRNTQSGGPSRGFPGGLSGSHGDRLRRAPWLETVEEVPAAQMPRGRWRSDQGPKRWVKNCQPTGVIAEQAYKHRARDAGVRRTGGNTDFDAPRRREVSRSAGPAAATLRRAQAFRAPLLGQGRGECGRGLQAHPAPSTIRAISRVCSPDCVPQR